jgi:D-alanyl-D-alanine carboxypeptidase (penicillin-binding protein 5/6)
MARRGLLVAVALAAAAWLPVATLAAEPSNPWPDAAAAYLVRIDGVERWSAGASTRQKPASLTKILTALLVLEKALPTAEVVVSARAARADGARIGLTAGMRMNVADLMTAMLLRSANDACLALAEHVAGSEAAFVAQMNARAAVMGLKDSHFANACGFDAPDHHASARDLAMIADAALAQPTFADIVAREKGTARARDGRIFRFDNTNVLLGRVDGARGVKTGWTKAAGRCLVGFAQRGNTRVLVVLLGAPDRWWDAVAMIESAFDEARGSRASAPPIAAPAPR